MNAVAAAVAGGAGILVGPPVAAIVYALPASGPFSVPPRCWTGRPAPRRAIVLTSVLTSTTAALGCSSLPLSLAQPAFWMFAVLGVALAGMDLRRKRLPYALTATLYLACTAGFIAEAFRSDDFGPLARASVTAVFVTAGMLAFALALPGQLGLGDVLFAGAVTFSLGWLSWQAAIVGLLAGLLIQGVVVLAAKVHRRDRALLPLGPALVIGWFLTVVLAG